MYKLRTAGTHLEHPALYGYIVEINNAITNLIGDYPIRNLPDFSNDELLELSAYIASIENSIIELENELSDGYDERLANTKNHFCEVKYEYDQYINSNVEQ